MRRVRRTDTDPTTTTARPAARAGSAAARLRVAAAEGSSRACRPPPPRRRSRRWRCRGATCTRPRGRPAARPGTSTWCVMGASCAMHPHLDDYDFVLVCCAACGTLVRLMFGYARQAMPRPRLILHYLTVRASMSDTWCLHSRFLGHRATHLHTTPQLDRRIEGSAAMMHGSSPCL